MQNLHPSLSKLSSLQQLIMLELRCIDQLARELRQLEQSADMKVRIHRRNAELHVIHALTGELR